MSEMVSMEQFGPVSVDYFHGHTVTSVKETENEDWVWEINFEAGGSILNFDPTFPKPDNLEGLIHTKTILGATQLDTDTGVRLYFGNNENPLQVVIHLNPMEYAIRDENYTKGKIVFAQRSDANMPDVRLRPDAE